jgi:two-component system sensor histidine kinase BaeS
LRNLADKELLYSPAGSTVMIDFVPSGGKILVAFANPAGELLEEDLPFLFERFYRGEKSRSREHGGAGIGLALVKELVEAHGGSVAAELREGLVRIRIVLPVLA